jgi:type VI secretion system protein ImpA
MQGLQALLGALDELMPSQESTLIDNASDAAPMPDADRQPKPAATPGVLGNRDEAIAQLLAIAAFVEKTEPTNPAPLLIRRAARLMRMGFMDILRELSPGSLSQIENIIGGSTPP